MREKEKKAINESFIHMKSLVQMKIFRKTQKKTHTISKILLASKTFILITIIIIIIRRSSRSSSITIIDAAEKKFTRLSLTLSLLFVFYEKKKYLVSFDRNWGSSPQRIFCRDIDWPQNIFLRICIPFEWWPHWAMARIKLGQQCIRIVHYGYCTFDVIFWGP